MKKTLVIANTLALIVTIAINYLSNSGILNGNTMKTMSDKYFNYFTPSGYAFSIWGLIYLGLFGFVFYSWRTHFKKKEESSFLSEIGWWFVISCCANSLWVIVWLYDYTGVSVLVLATLFISLLKIVIHTRAKLEKRSLKIYAFVLFPFSIYFGWVSVAFIANLAAYFTKINWSGFGISEVAWTIIMICMAGLVNLLMIWRRNLNEFAIVGVWALLAIAVSNKNNSEGLSISYACYAVSGLLLVAILVNTLNNYKRNLLS